MNNSKLCKLAREYEEKEDMEQAYHYYLEAALSENDGEAMYALGMMYMHEDFFHEDNMKAGKYFGMAFDNNVDIDPSMLIFAGSYWEKQGERNIKYLQNAIRYYEAAVKNEITYGHECLGATYYKLGDYEKAYEHLQQMDGRNPLGFYYLGCMYEEGKGLPRNLNKVIGLYRKCLECDAIGVNDNLIDQNAIMAKTRLRDLGVD